MFISYADDHAEGVFKFLNLATEKVLASRNIVWLKQCYGEYKGIKGEYIPVSPLEIDHEEEEDDEDEELNLDIAKELDMSEPILVEGGKIIDLDEISQNKFPEYQNVQKPEHPDLIGMAIDTTEDENSDSTNMGGEDIIINNDDDIIEETIRFFTDFKPNMTSFEANHDLDPLTEYRPDETQLNHTTADQLQDKKVEEYSVVEIIEQKQIKIQEKINRQLGTYYNVGN